jgi:hypothetical protein
LTRGNDFLAVPCVAVWPAPPQTNQDQLGDKCALFDVRQRIEEMVVVKCLWIRVPHIVISFGPVLTEIASLEFPVPAVRLLPRYEWSFSDGAKKQ